MRGQQAETGGGVQPGEENVVWKPHSPFQDLKGLQGSQGGIWDKDLECQEQGMGSD